MQRKAGVHTSTWQRWQQIHTELGFPLNNITQSVGDAPQSAGFHKADGTFKNEKGKAEKYCASFDVSLLHPHHYKGAELALLMVRALHYDILCFWRVRGQGFTSPHLHNIDCRLKMKAQLQRQVREWLNGGDGLVGNEPDPFWVGYANQVAYRMLKTRIEDAMEASNKWND
jgi:hypothetical protein